VILDEATSNLDAVTEVVVQEVIRKEFQDNTVITIAHRLDTLQYCDLVLALADGKVVRSGRPEEVINIASNMLLEDDEALLGLKIG